jgi:DNA-binding protein HU-beta
MTKTELIEEVVKSTGLTKKDSLKAIEAFLGKIKENLAKGEKVQLIPFGSFEVRLRKGRTGRNPKTGAKIQIKASKNVVFRAGKNLKEAVK